jgi:hypothetical protein
VLFLAAVMAGTAVFTAARALTLDEDRADAMYHYYSGGGVKVGGPALLVRKGIGGKTAVSAGYYADSISSASIDVVTTASKYSDQRDEYQVGVEHLAGDTRMSAGYTTSKENDYTANAVDLNVAHEVFGGLSTISMGYTRGQDVVGRVDTSETDTVDRDQFRLGLSQVLSPRVAVSLDYELVTDDGLLNNPYRAARVLGAFIPERYPRTRTSNALAVKSRYAVGAWGEGKGTGLRADYRYFQDTWSIAGHTFELGASRHFGARWLVDARYRFYTQDAASFFNDNFQQEELYMARDKELSTFVDHTVGLTGTYTIRGGAEESRVRANASAGLDYVMFDYADFTDVRTGAPYSFNALVLQLYLSVWY